MVSCDTCLFRSISTPACYVLQLFDGLNNGSAHWTSLQLVGAGLAEALVLAGLEHGAGLRVEAEGARVFLHRQPVQQLQLHVPEKEKAYLAKMFWIQTLNMILFGH